MPFPWLDMEKGFFGLKESLGSHKAEIAQIQMMLLHHPVALAQSRQALQEITTKPM